MGALINTIEGVLFFSGDKLQPNRPSSDSAVGVVGQSVSSGLLSPSRPETLLVATVGGGHAAVSRVAAGGAAGDPRRAVAARGRTSGALVDLVPWGFSSVSWY